ncbi:Unknown protein, partial [Striga hermonthica]
TKLSNSRAMRVLRVLVRVPWTRTSVACCCYACVLAAMLLPNNSHKNSLTLALTLYSRQGKRKGVKIKQLPHATLKNRRHMVGGENEGNGLSHSHVRAKTKGKKMLGPCAPIHARILARKRNKMCTVFGELRDKMLGSNCKRRSSIPSLDVCIRARELFLRLKSFTAARNGLPAAAVNKKQRAPSFYHRGRGRLFTQIFRNRGALHHRDPRSSPRLRRPRLVDLYEEDFENNNIIKYLTAARDGLPAPAVNKKHRSPSFHSRGRLLTQIVAASRHVATAGPYITATRGALRGLQIFMKQILKTISLRCKLSFEVVLVLFALEHIFLLAFDWDSILK